MLTFFRFLIAGSPCLPRRAGCRRPAGGAFGTREHESGARHPAGRLRSSAGPSHHPAFSQGRFIHF
jgi:hypothetical protein